MEPLSWSSLVPSSPRGTAALARAGAALICGAIAAIATTAVVRTLLVPRPSSRRAGEAQEDVAHFTSRAAQIAERLGRAIRLKSISYDPPSKAEDDGPAAKGDALGCRGNHSHQHGSVAPATDADVSAARAELHAFHSLLAAEYPHMHARLERAVINELSLVFVWRGADVAKPATCLYAHLDVVPAPDAAEWSSPPFAGVVVDGYVVGRGAM
jgi:acetylornithine deacetylase/succinyl-diaminopimelate desuccinylase-like protein